MRRSLLSNPFTMAAVAVVVALTAACTGESDDADVSPSTSGAPVTTDDVTVPDAEPSEGAPTTSEPASALPPVAGDLIDLLPASTRAMAQVDVAGMFDADVPADDVMAMLRGERADPAFADLIGAVGRLAASVDLEATVQRALVTQPADAASGVFLVAEVSGETLDDVVGDAALSQVGTHEQTGHPIYVDDAANHLALLPGGVLVAGSETAVAAVLDVAAGASPGGAGELASFVDPDADADVELAYALPGPAVVDSVDDVSLRSAVAMTGTLDVTADGVDGELAFHTPNAAEFVERYRTLNAPSTQGADPIEQPLELGEPLVGDLGRVVVPLAPMPIAPSFDEVRASRNQFKKLFPGMEALAYTDRVEAREAGAWLDFVVLSEANDRTPASPGSVYLRWEFRDQAAIDAFEANELPEGFRLAPTQFLESDDPEGEYFLALNLYNAGGGSIVAGTRAEWDVFVHGPDGADPNAGERPRFMVVDVLSEEVSADPGNLLTPAQPLSHELIDGTVVSTVERFGPDGAEPVFSVSFPVPDPEMAEVARFTREMAIGNDYIYWEHGVSDRVLYNATTFNHDAYLVDTSQLTFTDLSRWAEYLKPEIADAVYYVNDLEYVASPMANLDSDHLDITPERLAELVEFTTNGHQSGLMRTAVEQYFRGVADPFVGITIPNDTPATSYHFEVTDVAGLEAALDLPPRHRLAPTTLFVDGDPAHYLTLTVFDVAGVPEGTRAEWSVYTDDAHGRPPQMMVIDLMTEHVAYDPVSVLALPSDVAHEIEDGRVTTRLSSPTITFDATFETDEVTEHELSLDWIEAGDTVCTRLAVCDRYYYDAETLDVPVKRPLEVTIGAITTPWDEFLGDAPAVVAFRDNAQEYAVKRWFDLDVPVDELPFSGLADATHAVTGSGTLVGRTSDVADSTYTYTGDAIVEDGQVTFALDQEVVNALGVGHIFTTGSFDIATGSGTQTVVDCQGPALLCSDIRNGSTAFYTAAGLDASDLDAVSWEVDAVIDLGGSFGIADSASSFTATRTAP